MSVVETLPTTECATSSYELPSGSVKLHIRRKSAVCRLSRLVHQFYDWKNKHHYLWRYSVEKLLAFEEYQQMTSLRRVIAVVVLTPLLPLLVMITVAAIPLKNPLLSASENIVCFMQSACLYSTMTIGLLLFIRQALGWAQQQRIHPATHAAHLGPHRNDERVPDDGARVRLAVPRAVPRPARHGPFFIWFMLYHVTLVSKMLRANKKLIKYAPLLLCQTSTLFIFEGTAIIFKNVSANSQTALILSFPITKASLKRMIWHYDPSLSRHA